MRRKLVGPQCDDGIDSRRTACRDEARGQRDEAQNDRHTSEGSRVVDLYTVDETRDDAAEAETAGEADDDAEDADAHALADHEAEHTVGLGAERDAEPDLAATLVDGVREHAVDPD